MKTTMNHRLLSAGLVTLAMTAGVGMVSCKRIAQEANESKSVEGLLSNGEDAPARMACGPVPMTVDTPEAARNRAYVSLPPAMQAKDIASAMKLHYKLVDNPSSDCPKAWADKVEQYGESPATLNTDACWVAEKGDDGNLRPVIYLKKDAQSIHENLLRMTTYAFAEWYIDKLYAPAIASVAPVSDADIAFKAFVDQFIANRAMLTASVVDELSASAKTKSVVDTAIGIWKVVDAAALKKNPDYQNFVLAETIDAMYCSPQTARCDGGADMCFKKNGLPRTQDLFEKTMGGFFGTPWFDRVAVE